MSKNFKIKCRNCSNTLVVKEGGTVCDKCFAFNEYKNVQRSMDEVVDNKNENQVVNGKKQTNKFAKVILGVVILVIIFISISSTYLSQIKKIKGLYDVGQVVGNDFSGVIESDDVSLTIVETGFVREIESKGEQSLVYVSYDLDLKNRYVDVEYLPYLRLENGEYVKPLSSYELEELFGITEQQQFKNSISNWIDYNSPKGILMFKVEKNHKPIQLQINEMGINSDYYIDVLKNVYMMKLEV